MRTDRQRPTHGRRIAAFAAFLLALLVAVAPVNAREPDIRIGWTAWSDAEVISKMTYFMLTRLGLDAELTLADVSAQYKAIANNDLDVMLMSWQPQTHARYLDAYGAQMEDLGVLYDGADVGLAVPDYVDSSIQTIGDLAANADRFDRRIEGIGATAGVMGLTEEAMEAYGLDGFELREGSGPRMAQRLGRAIEQERPIVVTAWRPHWKWAEYDLRYLEDPTGVYDSVESVHAMARTGFSADYPRVAGLIERIDFDLDELQALMADAQRHGHRQAIRDWLNTHSRRVRGWIEGE